MHNNQQPQSNRQLSEGLEYGDLARLVHSTLHVDEFRSKMGDDADIVVLSFKVGGKEPATDLMNFIERGYDWVLDADVSAGELDDGEYLVFVELERSPKVPGQIMKLITDLLNLTEQDMSEWDFQYRKTPTAFPLTDDDLRKQVPLTPSNYDAKYGAEEEAEDEEDQEDLGSDLDADEADQELEAMKESARITTNKKAPVNDYTQSLRAAAGII